MSFHIKNWKLALLACVGVGLLTTLGFWQLSRAQQKKHLLVNFNQHQQNRFLTAQDLRQQQDWRFYRIRVRGQFDNQQTFLLDNKTLHGQVGYEVYTLFHVKDFPTPLLVDRGFIPRGHSRQSLPIIKPIKGEITLAGMLNTAPSYFALGDMTETPSLSWPLRIQYVNLSQLSDKLHTPLFPYLLTPSPHTPEMYEIEWRIVMMSPEKHLGYALQWFALALTLLILFLVLNRDRAR